MEGSDAELLAAGCNVLGSQHGSVGGGLVTIGLDLHATSNTGDGLTAAGITQMLASESSLLFILLRAHASHRLFLLRFLFPASTSTRARVAEARFREQRYGLNGEMQLTTGRDLRKIGDVDKGVVERGEDASNTEDELTCAQIVSILARQLHLRVDRVFHFLPSRV